MGSKNQECPDCGKIIWAGSVRCRSCAKKGCCGSTRLLEQARRFGYETEKAFLEYLYITCNMSQAEIAATLFLTSVGYHLRRLGIKKTGKWQRDKGKPSHGWVHQGTRVICVNGREVLEHRYLMEQHLGRPLERGEVVHHINGNHLDNRIENLQLMTYSTHTAHHNRGKSRKGQYHPPLTDAMKQKISLGQKRRLADPATRNRLSASLKQAWAEGKFANRRTRHALTVS